MKKIVQKKIDYSYLSISTSSIIVDSVINFDCYIKRYNGYVIIIDKGTKITQSLYDNISKQKDIYIHQLEQDLYIKYTSMHQLDGTGLSGNTITAELVTEMLHTDELLEKKISALYLYAFNIMNDFFNSDSNLAPLSDIKVYTDSLIYILTNSDYTFKEFLAVLPDKFNISAHSVSVSMLSTLLAKELNMTNHQLQAISLAAILHDSGNRNIQSSILDKKSTLSLDEVESVQKHVAESISIAKASGVRDSQVLYAIGAHHEKLDGSGYPEQLTGNQIPVSAQIIAVCDIFDALTTHRTYRKKYSSFEALMLIQRDMKKELNIKFVKLLIRILHNH